MLNFTIKMDIEAYRNRLNKSVADLARMLGVKEAAIYNYKYGKSKPSYESIEKMLLDGAAFEERPEERGIGTAGSGRIKTSPPA